MKIYKAKKDMSYVLKIEWPFGLGLFGGYHEETEFLFFLDFVGDEVCLF